MEDAETTGARGRLDAVLQGLVEKSDSERSVYTCIIAFVDCTLIIFWNTSLVAVVISFCLILLCSREQNEDDSGKMATDSLSKYD